MTVSAMAIKKRALFEATAVPLREAVGDWLSESKVDRRRGMVANVALLGPESRNGYRYALEAMREAAPLYDGRPVFIDHADGMAAGGYTLGLGFAPVENWRRRGSGESTPLRPRRSLRDYAGKVVAARFHNDQIRGDLHLFGPNAGWLFELIEAAPSEIGMSHVVVARRNDAGDQVDHIEKVVSVDIVAFPATVSSFAEQTAAFDGDAIEPLVGQGQLPAYACSAVLRRLLASWLDPAVFRAVLESCCAERPRSPERLETDGLLPHRQPHEVRRALIAAIRGAAAGLPQATARRQTAASIHR